MLLFHRPLKEFIEMSVRETASCQKPPCKMPPGAICKGGFWLANCCYQAMIQSRLFGYFELERRGPKRTQWAILIRRRSVTTVH
jgi:hypothetical protein